MNLIKEILPELTDQFLARIVTTATVKYSSYATISKVRKMKNEAEDRIEIELYKPTGVNTTKCKVTKAARSGEY